MKVIDIVGISLKNILKKKTNYEARNVVFRYLLQYFKNIKLSHAVINAAEINLNTISRLWKQAQASKINDNEILNVSQKNR